MLDVGAMKRIDEFEDALREFKDKIDSGTILHTAVISSRTLGKVDKICSFSTSLFSYFS